MNRFMALAAAMLLAVSFGTGCKKEKTTEEKLQDSFSQLKKDASKSLEGLNLDGMKKELTSKSKDVGKEISKLEASLKDASADTKKELEKQLDNLKDKQEDLEKALAKLEKDREKALADVQKQANALLDK